MFVLLLGKITSTIWIVPYRAVIASTLKQIVQLKKSYPDRSAKVDQTQRIQSRGTINQSGCGQALSLAMPRLQYMACQTNFTCGFGPAGPIITGPNLMLHQQPMSEECEIRQPMSRRMLNLIFILLAREAICYVYILEMLFMV